jgi:hypothetical protein
MNFFNKKQKFTNWSANIYNESEIHYPVNDDDIIKMIVKALKNNKIIRVVGSAHSISPVVCSSDESKIYLISLKKYMLGCGTPKEQIMIDHDNMTVKVNAGFVLGQLYDQLDEHSYFLETQPASPAFTIGGVVNMPVHGGRLGASLMADTITELILIDMYGKKIIKSDADPDFDLYRLSLGVAGIVISVTFRIRKFNDIKCQITTYQNVFNNGMINNNLVDDFFKDMIMKCLLNDHDEVHYSHSFLDFHNNKLLAVNWVSSDIKPIINVDIDNAEKICTLPTDIIHQVFLSDYRENSNYLKILGKIIRLGVEGSVMKNHLEDNNMLWVTTGTRVYFMSYFIPVHIEGQDFDLTNLHKALEIVKNQIDISVKNKKKFNVDFPMDIRFVVSNNKSRASPIYQLTNSNKIVYIAIDLTSGPSDIELASKKIAKSDIQLNNDFRLFYSSIENQWKKIGGVAHYSKMFGFKDASSGTNLTEKMRSEEQFTGSDPFDKSCLQLVFDPLLKVQLKSISQPLFVNEFVKYLIY